MSKKQIVRWVIAVLCILFVPVCGSPISVVLLLGAAITVAPVEAIQQHLKKPLNIIIPVVFFVAAVMAAPNTTSQKTAADYTAMGKYLGSLVVGGEQKRSDVSRLGLKEPAP